jgi:hypothetical protein
VSPWIAAIVGVLAGLAISVALTLVVAEIVLPMIGAGDHMSRGIMATIVLVFSAPAFALLGGFLGYKRSLRRRGVG